MSDQQPSIGRIVIYNHVSHSAGSPFPPGEQSPAIIQDVAPDGSVRLFIIGPRVTRWTEGVTQGDGLGQWNWPVRVP